jgi:hypothetical protein
LRKSGARGRRSDNAQFLANRRPHRRAAASEDDNRRGNFQIPLNLYVADNYAMEVRSDPFESAKWHFFDTSTWGAFCDVTLTLKQARQSDSGCWVKIDDYRCRQAFRHFMNLLNRAVYGAAFRRYGKMLRVLPVLEKGEVRGRVSRSWDRGTPGRWHSRRLCRQSGARAELATQSQCCGEPGVVEGDPLARQRPVDLDGARDRLASE